jgi:hypothetical protein
VAFFDQANPIFSPETQRWSVEKIFESGFLEIREAIEETLEQRLEESGALSDYEISQVVASAIADGHTYWTGADRSPSLPAGHRRTVIKDYAAQITSAAEEVFQKLPLNATARKQLRELAGSYLTADIANPESPFHTGIVIAGFGQQDMFPRLFQFEFEAISLNRLKHKAGHTVQISPDERAVIIPFAQSEQVDTFMTGIDPEIARAISEYWSGRLHDSMKSALSQVTLDPATETKLIKLVDERCAELLERYAEGLRRCATANTSGRSFAS